MYTCSTRRERSSRTFVRPYNKSSVLASQISFRRESRRMDHPLSTLAFLDDAPAVSGSPFCRHTRSIADKSILHRIAARCFSSACLFFTDSPTGRWRLVRPTGLRALLLVPVGILHLRLEACNTKHLDRDVSRIELQSDFLESTFL